jgi:hypothetical protein
VSIDRIWGATDDTRPCYYAGRLHNLPLASRYVLCVVVVTLMVPTLTLLKRKTNSIARDAVVATLERQGQIGTAAFCVRAFKVPIPVMHAQLPLDHSPGQQLLSN